METKFQQFLTSATVSNELQASATMLGPNSGPAQFQSKSSLALILIL